VRVQCYEIAVIFGQSTYRDILREELQLRRENNPQFSLRAFANKLGLAPSTLSDVLNGKQGLSRKKGQSLAKRLAYTRMETDFFLSLIDFEDGRSSTVREEASQRLKSFHQRNELELNLEQWEVMSHWHYPALLELTKTQNFKSDLGWISERLGISKEEAAEALGRLVELGILRKDNRGRYSATGQWLLKSPHDVPLRCTKNVHKEIMQRALVAMHTYPVKDRNMNALIMSIDSDRFGEARALISKFNTDLNRLLTQSKKRDQVFCFSSQFFCMEAYKANDNDLEEKANDTANV